MQVDVQLNDDELALLSGYSRSTSMGIKKPGELQRELLSDMENIEEKRMVSVPEVENASEDSIDEADDVMDDAPVGVRADFLSMLSELAKPDTNKAGINEDEDGYEDDEDDDDDDGILPDDEDEEGDVYGGILPDDDDEEIDGADGVTLPDDDEGEEGNGESLPDDDEEDNDDEDDWQGGVLPDDDEEDYQDGVLPDDDEEDLQGIASEEETTGIPLEDEGNSEELSEDEDEGDSELPEDEDDGDSELPEDEDDGDSGELPEDEDEELSEDEDEGDYELPEDEDEDDYDSEELPADEDEDASGELPEDDVEEVPESTEEHIDSTLSRIAPVVVEKPVSSTSRRQKIARPVSKQSVGRPAGYSTPPASLYDFILSNGGSMLIEDVKKYYPIDEVKKALNLGKIYRFGNKVGV